MNTQCVYESKDESATDRLGAALATAVPDGMVIGLVGELGAGKTRLVKAVATACGVDPQDVTSPTFVLVQAYHGQRDLIHVDAYRLADEDEFLALGPEEWFASGALTFVEWADRVAACLPRDRLTVAIGVTGDEVRRITVSAHGDAAAQAVAALRSQLQA